MVDVPPRGEIKALVIDDEASIRRTLRASLEAQGYRVREAEDGEAGLREAADFHPHVVLLDLGMPRMGGEETIRRLREWTEVPVIALTVDEDSETKVRVLDAGADDYLTKPFSIAELMARIRAALRKTRGIEATPVFRSGDLEIDVNAKIVRVDGAEVKMTATQFAFLRTLARAQGRVVSQRQLLTDVWGPAAVSETHYLRIYCAQVRKKIERDPSNPQHLLTEPGVGYRLA